jgi:hypothetical protein
MVVVLVVVKGWRGAVACGEGDGVWIWVGRCCCVGRSGKMGQ